MLTKEIIELIAAAAIPIGLLGLFHNRYKLERSIGVRSIQFSAVVFVIPTILILALEGILNTEVIATLLGTIIGYTLSSIEDKSKDKQ